MNLAVFTNQFPGKVNTFFARDIASLLKYGINVEIFPIYPHDPSLWKYVPDILFKNGLTINNVHHININNCLSLRKYCPLNKLIPLVNDISAIIASAKQYGGIPIIKSLYAAIKGWGFAQNWKNYFDHILAYWGNYAGTCAYIFHRLIAQDIPFSTFLHAGTDLYRDQIYLKEKLLYADNIITVSEFNRNYILEKYSDISQLLAEKIFIHHLGLDLDNFPFKSKNKSYKKIIGVGRLEKLKGFDLLLRAVGELTSKHMDIMLELIGDGEDTNMLKKLADNLGIGEKVNFRGWLPFSEVRNAIMDAAILVHPSIGLGDNVPTVIKEAMALGTPVIASNVAGIPELLNYGECGILVPPKNLNHLVKAINMLIKNDVLRQQYAQKGRRYVEHKFDLWKNGKCLAEVLISTKR